jgi:hypothetical protein
LRWKSARKLVCHLIAGVMARWRQQALPSMPYEAFNLEL